MKAPLRRYAPHALAVAATLGVAGLLLLSDPGKPPLPEAERAEIVSPTPSATPSPTPTSTLAPDPPPTMTPEPTSSAGPFVCDREASHHVFETLRPGSGSCEADGSCVSITDGLSNIDLDAICPATLPVSRQRTRSELDSLRLRDESIRCRRQLSMFACSVTCFHETDGSTHEELRRDYAEYVQWMRDRYGAESDASRQGTPAYPREQHRWREGATTLSIDLHTSVCPPDPDHERHASYRTHYTRTRTR